MVSRAASAVLVASVLAFGMTGCVAAADAKPSATKSVSAFKTDAEAYKAAEKVYRDYVAASNRIDLADPKTFEPLYALTVGDANAAERKDLSQMHADKWKVSGATKITLIADDRSADGSLALAVCTDLTDIRVTDSAGASMISPDRSDTQSILVVFTETPHGIRISGFFGRKDEPACPAR